MNFSGGCLHSRTGALNSTPSIWPLNRWLPGGELDGDVSAMIRVFHLWTGITHHFSGLTNHQGEKEPWARNKRDEDPNKREVMFFFWGVFLVCECIFSIYENRILWENLAMFFVPHILFFHVSSFKDFEWFPVEDIQSLEFNQNHQQLPGSMVTPWKVRCRLKGDHFENNIIFQPSFFMGDRDVSFGGS